MGQIFVAFSKYLNFTSKNLDLTSLLVNEFNEGGGGDYVYSRAYAYSWL